MRIIILFFIVVESFASLAAELVLRDEFFERFDWRKERLFRISRVPPVQNKFICVQTDVIGQGEGTHWITSAQSHRSI